MPEPAPGHGALRSTAALVVTALLTAVAGLPGGLAWAAIAPRPLVVVTGRGAADVANPETSAFIAADGWFCVVGVAGGLLCGLVAYFAVVRSRGGAPGSGAPGSRAAGSGAAAAAGLIIGGFGASLVASWLGHSIGLSAFHAGLLTRHAGAVLHAPLMLRAGPALVCWPLAASLTVVVAEMIEGRERRRPRPASTAGTQRAEVSSR